MKCEVYVGGRYNTTLGRGVGTYFLFSEGKKVWEDSISFDYDGRSSMVAEAFACERALEKATYLNFKEITVHCSSNNLAELINTGGTKFHDLKQFVLAIRNYNRKLLKLVAKCDSHIGVSRARNKSVHELQKDSEVKGKYMLYADGFLDVGKYYGGVVITKQDKIIFEKRYCSSNLMSSGKLAGTMLAIVEGLIWCTEQGIKDIIVVCSDEIICKWANGTYKARKPNGRKFVNFISNLDIKYTFVKDYAKVSINLNRAKHIAERGYAYDCLDRQ